MTGAHAVQDVRAPWVRASVLTCVLALVAVLFGPITAAVAAPGILLSKDAPGEVLAGQPITFTLTATNPPSNPDAAPEYNLAFRDVIPSDVTYVGGSTTPAGAGDPVQWTDPDTGMTTLTWTNVTDLSVNGATTLTFQVMPDPVVYPVGTTVENTADVYSSTDPFVAPEFDELGVLVPGTATETATSNPTTTLISALQITKDEPSPEGELLRGVHDNDTVYSLTIESAPAAGSTGLVVTDYIPARLEYLGCGGVDNSATPEFPGAPSLTATPTPADCLTPTSVTTVQDPPPNGTTTYPPGVYTRVEWSIPDIAASSTFTLRYAAGVPLRANVMFPDPAPGGLLQTANLDNNTGASTRETATELGATNVAQVTGTFQGTTAPGVPATVSASDTLTVSIEDVRMRKTADRSEFLSGGTVRYTLTVESSEYVSAADIVLADTLPNGTCPLGGPGTNYSPGANPLCDGGRAPAPSVPIATATFNVDGTFDITFDALAEGPDATTTVSYSAAMLPTYLGGALVGQATATGDSFTNDASLTATTTPVAGTGETGTVTVEDESEWTLTTGSESIDKLIAPRSISGGTCPTDAGVYGEPAAFAPEETLFLKGDRVCYLLTANFSPLTETRNPQVTDFLPPGMTYVNGSATAAATNADAPFTVTSSTSAVQFLIGTPGPAGNRFVDPGAVFAVVIQANVTRAAPGTTALTRSNLMKLRAENSAGITETLRDSLVMQGAPVPPVQVVKGVESVDAPASGPNPANSNVDGSEVRAGSVATFRIDLTNGGVAGTANGYEVGALDVWDKLPVQLTCDDIDESTVRYEPAQAVPPTVVCTDPGEPGHPAFLGSADLSLLRVTFPIDGTQPDLSGQGVGPGATQSILYDTTIPDPAGVGTVYTDTAYVSSYQALTNVPGGGTVTFYPRQNVNLAVLPTQWDAPAASDPSNVRVPGPEVDKSATTSVVETNNDLENEATIGELVTYTYGVRILAGTAAYDGVLQDPLPTGFVQVGPATLTYHPDADSAATAPVPAGVTIDPDTGTVTFPSTYNNATAVDQRFEVVLPAQVTGAAMSTAQNNLQVINTARFVSLETLGGSALPPATASWTITVRQPRPDVTKANDSDGPVPGGTTVAYTVSARNVNTDGSGATRTPLHDTFLVDCLPAGMIFDAYGADPGAAPAAGGTANGCAAGTTALVWNVGTIEPGATATRTYTAIVPLDAIAGTTYVNNVTLSGSTLDDGKASPTDPDNPDERVVTDTASSTVPIVGADITKSVTPDRATIGQEVTWRVDVEISPNTTYFDATLVDHLPAGVDDVAITDYGCQVLTTPATDCTIVPVRLNDAAGPGGSTLVAWNYGDLPPSVDIRIVSVTYTGKIADVPGNVAGVTLTNTAHTAWNVSPDSPNDDPQSADAPFDTTGPSASATVTVIEPQVTVDKAVSDATPGPADSFEYTITAHNSPDPTSSDSWNGVLQDVVPVGVVVDPDSIAFGGVLTGDDPVRGGGLITWDTRGLAIAYPPGADVTVTYEATLAPSEDIDATPLANTVTVTNYESLESGGRVYSGPSATAQVVPAFPQLTTVKTAVSPAPAYIGSPFTWRVATTNTGTAPAFGIDITDTLPAGWEYVPGSSQLTAATGTTSAHADPLVALGVAVWSDLGTLQPGQSASMTFQLRPTTAVLPNVGSTVPQLNRARTIGEDATGATGNLDGPYDNGQVTAQTRIDSADVQVTKTHASPVVAGANARWTLTVRNNGADPAVGPFTVTDTLPPGTGFVSASGTGWTCGAPVSGVVSCARTTPPGTLASGASFPVITVVTSIPAATPSGTAFTNGATANARTYDPNTANNSTTDAVTITTSADLAITKTHAGPGVAGQDTAWTIGVHNNGPSDSQPTITVSDTLPAGTTFVSAVGVGWSCAPPVGQTFSCTRSTVLASGAVAPQILVVAHISSGLTGTLTNSATVTGTTPDPVPANNTATSPLTITTSADLAIQKAHAGAFTPGTQGTYTFAVVNNGPSDAAAPVTITDTLPDDLTFASTVDPTGTWTCSAAGQLVTCTLAGSLALNASTTVSIVVDVDPAAGAGSFENTATVDSPTPDPNPVNNTDTDDTSFSSISDLALDKSHTGPVDAGANVVWTLQVSNLGPSATVGPITVADGLPDDVDYVSATGVGWTCSAVDQVVTCTTPDGIAGGTPGSPALAEPITLTAFVHADAGPSIIVNHASVDGPQADPDLSNNDASDPVIVRDEADVSVVKTVTSPAPYLAGTQVTYTLTVGNAGPSFADDLHVVDTLPPGMSGVSGSGPGWTCVVSTTEIVCDRPVLAAPVASPVNTSVITVTGQIGADVLDGTTLTNTAVVGTATTDTDPSNNQDDESISVAAAADLAITKSHPAGRFDAGQEVPFTIVVTNNGPSDALAPIEVTDTLPPGFTYVSSSGPWTCTPNGAGTTVVCDLDGVTSLAAGATAPDLVVTTQIDPSASAGPVLNTATVDSPTTDPDPGNNTTTDPVLVQQAADVRILKTHTGAVRVGDDVTFHLTVFNVGPSDAQDVVVNDPLPRGLTYVSATGTDWTCTTILSAVRCAYDLPLAANRFAPQIDLVVTVGPEAFPTVRNIADVDTSTDGDNRDDNIATDDLGVPAQVDLSITKTHAADFVVGSTGTWTMLVSNAGPTDDPGPVTVTDTLPAGTTFVSASGPGATCTAAGQTVTCVLADGVTIATPVTITLVVSVQADAYPSVTNAVTVGTDAEDLDPDNNTATDDVDVLGLSRLAIVKDVVGIPGTQPVFDLTVTNLGPNATTAPVTVTDQLPVGLTYVSATGVGWTCDAVSNAVTCTYSASLAVSQSAPSVRVQTTLTAPPGTSVVNVATATGGQPLCPDCVPVYVQDDATVVAPDDSTLSATGTDALAWAILALVLLGGGIVMVGVSRRRWIT